MAANTYSWNVNVDGCFYKVDLTKNKVSINNGEEIKLNKLNKKAVFPHMAYFLQLGSKQAVLNVRQGGEPVLTIDGRNCVTGEPFALTPMPGWGWVFIVLHLLNFFLLIGGAIGGACLGGMSIVTMGIAANNETSTGKRVAWCTIIWLVATAIEFVLALIFTYMFSRL